MGEMSLAGGDSAKKSAPVAAAPAKRGMRWEICPSKGPGRAGRKVRIETNYLALNVDKIKAVAYHYDIQIEPDKPKRLMRAVFSEFRRRNFGNTAVAFDGQKNAYAPVKLPLDKKLIREISVVDEETGQTRVYMVAIQEVRGSAIDLSCLQK